MMDVDEIKKEVDEDGNEEIDLEKLSYEEKLKFITPIAQPLAPKKLCKKILKLIKKAKSQATKKDGGLRFGLKDVTRRVRLGEKGMAFIAGDVTPMDVIMHLPVYFEDNNIPYCYLPCRNDIGTALGIAHRGPIVVLVSPKPDYQELYDLVWEKIKLLPLPI